MVKRIISVVVMIVVLATLMVAPVSAAENVTGNLISEDTVDDCIDLLKTYSDSGNVEPREAKVDGSEDATYLGVKDGSLSETWNLIYKAAEGEDFSEVTVNMTRYYEPIKYPVIYTSDNGDDWTEKSTVMSEAGSAPSEWKRITPDGHTYYAYEAKVAFEKPVKYVKVEVQPNSAGSIYRLRIEKVSLKLANTISEDTLDDCIDLSKAYSNSGNFEPRVSTVSGSDDATFFGVKEGSLSEAWNIVYKASEGEGFSETTVRMARFYEAIKYPVIYTSDNGEDWTAKSTVMSEASSAPSEWKRITDGSADYYPYQAKITFEKPVKYVKVEVQPNSTNGINKIRIEKVDLNLENTISENTTDICDEFSNVYKNNNMVSATEESGFGDENLWRPNAFNEEGSVVYKAANGKFFSNIYVEIERQNDVLYPTVEWSADGDTWNKLTETTEKAYAPPAEWSKNEPFQGTVNQYSYGYHAKFDMNVNDGVKYFKITMKANDGAIFLKEVKLEVESGKDSYEISVNAEGKAEAKRLNLSVPAANEKAATLIIAEYNLATDQLTNAFLDYVNLKADGTVVERTLAPSDQNTYFKAFLLENITSLIPYTISATSK